MTNFFRLFFKKTFFFFLRKIFFSLDMDLIFGNEKELRKEHKFLINEALPSLNKCNFCNKLKCKYCKKYSVNCTMCKKDICFNCRKFNKSKDILINCNNKFISDYVKNF